MIKTKKIVFSILIFFLSIGNSNSNIEDSLFISVGNIAITRSDIINEIKLILILNGQVYSEENKHRGILTYLKEAQSCTWPVSLCYS